MKMSDLLQESKSVKTPTPRNPVAKAAQTVAKGSGAHKNPKKTLPRQDKHKKKALPMDEMSGTLHNDPEKGHQLIPSGGFGTWDEKSLVSSLTRDLTKLIEDIKFGNYTGAEHVMYQKYSTVKTKLETLASYQRWKEKQGKRPIARNKQVAMPDRETVEEQFCEECGGSLAEHGKASKALCVSRKPDDELGASNLASCKAQGLRARDGKKSHKLGKSPKSRITVGGHKIKGHKYGGPLPDWS